MSSCMNTRVLKRFMCLRNRLKWMNYAVFMWSRISRKLITGLWPLPLDQFLTKKCRHLQQKFVLLSETQTVSNGSEQNFQRMASWHNKELITFRQWSESECRSRDYLKDLLTVRSRVVFHIWHLKYLGELCAFRKLLVKWHTWEKTQSYKNE